MRMNHLFIKQQRQLRGWTQQHLSEVSGISLRTIQRVEASGQGSHETISALASVLEVDRASLLITNTNQDTNQDKNQDTNQSMPSWPLVASAIVGAVLGAITTYFLLQ